MGVGLVAGWVDVLALVDGNDDGGQSTAFRRHRDLIVPCPRLRRMRERLRSVFAECRSRRFGYVEEQPGTTTVPLIRYKGQLQ